MVVSFGGPSDQEGNAFRIFAKRNNVHQQNLNGTNAYKDTDALKSNYFHMFQNYMCEATSN